MFRKDLAVAPLILLAAFGPAFPLGEAAAAAPRIERPALWSVDTVGEPTRPAKTILVCADHAVRTAFMHSLPSPGGKPCQIIGRPVISEKNFSARCRTDGVVFTAHSDVQGDPARAFTVATAISADSQPGRSYEQTLRLKRVGICPAGWAVGDSAAPGERHIVNALSGATRTAPEPVR